MNVLVVYTDRYSPLTPFLAEYIEGLSDTIVSRSIDTTGGEVSTAFESECRRSDIVVFCLSESDQSNPSFWKLMGISESLDVETFVLYKEDVEVKVLPIDISHDKLYNIDLPHDLERLRSDLTKRKTLQQRDTIEKKETTRKKSTNRNDTKDPNGIHNEDKREWEEAKKVILLFDQWVQNIRDSNIKRGLRFFKNKISYVYVTIAMLLIYHTLSYGMKVYSNQLEKRNEKVSSIATAEDTNLNLPSDNFDVRYSFETFDDALYEPKSSLDQLVDEGSAWRSTHYFSLVDETDKEKRIVEKWFEGKDWYDTNSGKPTSILLTTDYLLDNVEHLYVEQIIKSVNNGSYGRAAKLSRRAVNLVGDYRIDPDLGNAGLKKRLDRVYLFWLLTRHPSKLYRYPQATQLLASYISDFQNFFPDSKESELRRIDTNGVLLPIKTYFQGVYHFKERDYNSAFSTFDRLSRSSWRGMASFANMMAARTAFWSVENGRPIQTLSDVNNTKRRQRLKSIIKSRNEGVNLFSLPSDMEYYLSEIK